MPDLSITAANVVPAAGAPLISGIAGAAITPGQPVYVDPADNLVKLANANNAAAVARSPVGLAVNTAATGQVVAYQREGDLALGSVLSRGVAYYLSRTSGRIAPFGDLTTGDFPVLLGIARSATVLNVTIREAGAAL